MTDDLSERILDAAYRLIAKHGLRRTSIADIVRESGVSKATLFRRFPSRAALLHALMVREVTAFLRDLDERLAPVDDPADRLMLVFTRFVEVVRGHEVLRNLVETDPETVLPLLTVDAAPTLAFGQEFMRAELQRLADQGVELTAPPAVGAELLTRLSHSYLLLPETALTPDELRASLVPMLLRLP